MWPTLISVGPIAIQSFGVLVGLGVFLGGFVFWSKGKEEGFEAEALMDSWLISGVMALVVGRAWYVLEHWSEFGKSVYKWLFLTKFPGLSYEGVLIGVFLSWLIFGLKKKWQVWRMLEVGVMAWLMVEMFGWLGSFLAGSSLGRSTNWFWGMSFPGAESRRHPVQLIWFVLVWLVFVLLKSWETKYRSFNWYKSKKGEAKPGFLVAMFLLLIGAMRLGMSFLMNGVNRWFGVGLVLIGGLILVERSGIKITLAKTKLKEKQPKVKVKLKKRKSLRNRKKRGFDFYE